MQWFFAFDENSTDWFSDMIKVAVVTAKRVGLEPHCLYDGSPTKLTRWLERNGVTVHFHQVPFRDELFSTDTLKENAGTHYSPNHAAGAFQRICAAHIATDPVFLYTDCDVMFTDGRIAELHTETIAAIPESRDSFNSGVILINTQFWLSEYDALVERLRGYGWYHRKASSYDQVILNEHFRDRWDRLPAIFNWRPWHGLNTDASIVHFHGPKPHRVKALLNGEGSAEEADLADLIRGKEDAYSYYLSAFERHLPPPLWQRVIARVTPLFRPQRIYRNVPLNT